jgi:hypothetical protein
MKRLFVTCIVLSMIGAGLLVLLSASMVEDAKARGVDKKDIWKSVDKADSKVSEAKNHVLKKLAEKGQSGQTNDLPDQTGRTIGAGQVTEIVK